MDVPVLDAATSSAPLRIAVVGAGVSGVVTARVLADQGLDVTVLEQRDDVGGVWSASRAYPGISTQDDRTSYAFSDAPLAEGGAHPTGAEVQGYLSEYLRSRAAHVTVRLRTRVLRARSSDDGWELELEGPDGVTTERFDWLVAANGVFSTPHVPDWAGRTAFEAAGGRVVSPSDLGDGAVLDGARTVVVGWGKTACDVAAAAAPRSARVDLVARRLMWKLPKRIGLGGLTFKHLILTRAGERLILGGYRGPTGRLLLRRLPERLPRVLLGRAIARAVDRTSGLSGLGLRPLSDIRSSNSLVTEGFFEAVQDGAIQVHRERAITELGGDDEGPWARLTGGERLLADVVVAATGYEQGIPFLDPDLLGRAQVDGALLLHRRTLAVDMPHLAVVGWAHSYRSPITSEIAAVWLAGVIGGSVRLPGTADQRAGADRFALVRSTEPGAGTGLLPGVTMQDLDVMLQEVGAPLPLRLRLRQIWRPLDPADYREALVRAADRIRGAAPRQHREPIAR